MTQKQYLKVPAGDCGGGAILSRWVGQGATRGGGALTVWDVFPVAQDGADGPTRVGGGSSGVIPSSLNPISIFVRNKDIK